MATKSRPLAGKVVLITGGTSGIGLALAEAFLARGSAVAVCGRSAARIERFERRHPQAIGVRADVTSAADRADLLDTVAARLGRVDILVNNAGTFVERDFTSGEAATEQLEEEIALNLTAPIRLTAAVLARNPAPDAILFVTSGYALVSPARAPTYGAVKAGLHGFADGLRRRLAPRGTDVLEVLPPMTDTPMNAAAPGTKLPAADVAAAALRALDRGQPMALPGAVRLLPTMLRIAPGLVADRVGAT